MATKTANGIYSYDKVFYDKKLSELIQLVHVKMSKKLNLTYIPVKPGEFGYDNYAMSIGHLLSNYIISSSLDELASLVHDGWSCNYTYWKLNEPWKEAGIEAGTGGSIEAGTGGSIEAGKCSSKGSSISSSNYIQPATPLGDERRNKCASLPYKFLSKEEQDKDLIIVTSIIDILDLLHIN